MTTETTLTEHFPDVPLPAGAVEADLWGAVGDGDGRLCRVIRGLTRSVQGYSDIQVWTGALQYSDGSLADDAIDRPSVWVDGEALGSDQARELAAALVEAAAELDGWVGR